MKAILIADDEEVIREPLKTVLERADYDVSEAADGNEVMNILNNKHIDLLVTDLAMPEKDGFETLMDIRQKYPDLNVVVMTGVIDIDQSSFAAWIDQYHIKHVLEKPFKLKHFLKVVKKALHNK